ncbi:SWIM zinc finger domain-containing protein [Streptomyces noursei]|nr:SWIM zinc finger domain-containing protein [Streptomyces noursei]
MGMCEGGDGARYGTVVDLDGPAFQCSCPSRKFPCKHALGLLLRWAGGEAGEPARPGTVRPRAGAAAVGGRVAGGAPGAVRPPAGRRGAGGPGAGGSEADGPGAASRAPADPEAARRRAARRMQRIAAGATELEQRLEDLLHSGLAAAGPAAGAAARTGADDPGGGRGSWEETAARMVDAQAPGLASRVRELGAIATSGPDWPSRLLEECALLHLLDQGFLGIDRLPPPLAATVRARVGLTTDAADVRSDPETVTIRDRWLVLAQQDGAEGPLTTRRIFLRGERTGRMALHRSFGGAHRPWRCRSRPACCSTPTWPTTRAPGRCASPSVSGTPRDPGAGPDRLRHRRRAGRVRPCAARRPWLDAWPVVLADVTPIPGGAGGGWQLADADGESALPLDPRCLGRPALWQLAAVSGGAPVTVFGECGHRGFLPLTVWDPAPVSLSP